MISRQKNNPHAVAGTFNTHPPRSSTDLLSLALSKMTDIDTEELWETIVILQDRLPEIYNDILALARSTDPRVLELAANILGQSRVEHKSMESQCVAELRHILSQANDASLLTSAIYAIGHRRDAGIVDAVLPFATHENAEVRHAVAFSLGACEDDKAIEALITLSRDSDYEVRNWATFGIGTLTERDTPEIRGALAARLHEEGEEAHGEALVGLVIRRDSRAIGPLLEHLTESTDGDLIPLVWDCVDQLIEFRSEYTSEWSPIFNALAKKFPDYKGPVWMRHTEEK